MYVLDSHCLKTAAKKMGYAGFAPLLRKLKLHRNTLNRYLAGTSVLPESLTKIIEHLDIPLNVVLKKASPERGKSLDSSVLSLVDTLAVRYSYCSFFLFGSRAANRARTYSDYDIGIYAKEGLRWEDYQDMLILKEQFEDSSAYYVDLVDLTKADNEFLSAIEPNLVLLAGRYRDYLNIVETVSKS